jgi:hypothetical protein
MLERLRKIDFEFVLGFIVAVICGVAWAYVGFPHFTEVALPIGLLGAVVAGGLLWLTRRPT